MVINRGARRFTRRSIFFQIQLQQTRALTQYQFPADRPQRRRGIAPWPRIRTRKNFQPRAVRQSQSAAHRRMRTTKDERSLDDACCHFELARLTSGLIPKCLNRQTNRTGIVKSGDSMKRPGGRVNHPGGSEFTTGQACPSQANVERRIHWR